MGLGVPSGNAAPISESTLSELVRASDCTKTAHGVVPQTGSSVVLTGEGSVSTSLARNWNRASVATGSVWYSELGA